MINRIGVRRDDGASAVELALMLPLLIMLLFGIIEFGFIFMQDLGVSNAARQGARIGVQSGNTCLDVSDSVYSGSGTLSLTNTTVEMELLPRSPDRRGVCKSFGEMPCATANRGDRLRVRVIYGDASLEIPLVMSKDIKLVRDGVFRCEYHAS